MSPEFIKFRRSFNKRVESIVMFLTSSCNLNCSYCYVDKKKESMNFITARNSVDFLMNSPGEKKEIHFFGGEPLLAFGLIKRVIDYAESRYKKKIGYVITTNGILLDLKKAGYLKEKGFRINISLDGPKAVNDKHRKLNNGKGSFDLIFRNISGLKKAKISFNINITVHPSSAKNLFKSCLFVLNNAGDDINVLPVSLMPWKKKDIICFLKNSYDIISYYKKKKIKGRLNLIGSIKNAEDASFSEYAVCPFKAAISIMPDGNIIFCHLFLYLNKIPMNYITGNVNKGVKKEYHSCKLSNAEKCRNCSADYCRSFCKNFEKSNHSICTFHFIKLAKRLYEKHSKP